MKRLIASLGLVLAAALLPGCPVTGDIGYPCRLVRGLADGGMVAILESEIPPGRDVIAFGAIECEDFVCVRNRYAPIRTDGGSGDAYGTCSARCVPSNADSCKGLSPQASLAEGPYTCRALLLDEETIAAICSTDPVTCRNLFGDNQTPYFCAQGADLPDGGI